VQGIVAVIGMEADLDVIAPAARLQEFLHLETEVALDLKHRALARRSASKTALPCTPSDGIKQPGSLEFDQLQHFIARWERPTFQQDISHGRREAEAEHQAIVNYGM
jgi:hypothetical protein